MLGLVALEEYHLERGLCKMNKLLTILLLAFCIYTFISISTQAKAEVMQSTINIPVKITQAIANVMASIDEARVVSVKN